jgi:GTP-binding protein EngB required for normal cell division
MASLAELLTRAISSVPHPSEAQREIVDRLSALRSRFDEGLLRVAVLGQFKRGKSTLLNALLGARVLPTGVTPVTALSTFISAGDSTRLRIAFRNGEEPTVTAVASEVPGVLERYVSETHNPRNRLEVESVAVEVRSDFLDQGIALIDTPGVGSTLLHNTRAAEAALSECDAALFVLSADPPITEAETNYLDKVRKLILSVFFVLNKADLLDAAEKIVAERFLAGVLAERRPGEPPDRIFALSAKRALQAKLANDKGALEASGLPRLERLLAGELARDKRAILLATGRLRLISLVGELLFQSELERKALLTPEEELKRKAATFEASAVEFETERQRLSDLLSIDCKRMLQDLDAETDRVWREARGELRRIVSEIGDGSVERKSARQRMTAALSRYFEQALRETVDLFRAKLDERVSVHRDRAGALVNLVRQTAADLMQISANLPRPEEAFQPKREPYWVAPEPAVSLLDLSAGAAARLLPRTLRERRARDHLVADAERAALRNVANLDWALRQNIEDSFRRFESSLSEQLDQALQATRQALQLAQRRRAARSEAIEADVEQADRCVRELSAILAELQAIEREPRGASAREGARAC